MNQETKIKSTEQAKEVVFYVILHFNLLRFFTASKTWNASSLGVIRKFEFLKQLIHREYKQMLQSSNILLIVINYSFLSNLFYKLCVSNESFWLKRKKGHITLSKETTANRGLKVILFIYLFCLIHHFQLISL